MVCRGALWASFYNDIIILNNFTLFLKDIMIIYKLKEIYKWKQRQNIENIKNIINLESNKIAELGGYLVKEEYRKKGIMKKLETILINEAKQLNIEYIVATVHPENIASNKATQYTGAKIVKTTNIGQYLRNIYLLHVDQLIDKKFTKNVSKSKIYVIIDIKGRCNSMQREMTIQEVQKTLTEDDIEETILLKRSGKNDIVIMNFEEYKKIFEMNLIERLKKAEEQIKNGEVTDANIVFKEMREKYGYQ